jgi:hypothetical protein
MADPMLMAKNGTLTTEYGNISGASIGIIRRGLLQIETQGGEKFFGEPMPLLEAARRSRSVKVCSTCWPQPS